MRPTPARVLVSALFAVAVLTGCGQPSSTSPGLPGGPGGDTPVSATHPPADPSRASNRGMVTGTVARADGSPVPGVGIEVKSTDKPAKPVPELVVTTDAKGVFQWNLEPGRYEFHIRTGGTSISGRAAPQPATVTVGQTSTVNFTLT
ncbi:carboxypeptidase-like regulatory domain-containing protein [Micromonospora sp. NBC_01699]|uniref:carboxypeptidase-like regulatory domain-containing protein n=1 Tax=Micromonospora sp. NBC_01699 TaxID=2975984 RepID=UPI002E3401D7|nr:carboxypeptidase-like regulatory domain-containing protein [Micromonospora sp. NBC_01699]